MHAEGNLTRWAVACLLAGLMLLTVGVRVACGAEVRLKNGNLVKGEIVIETDTILIVNIGGGQVTLQKADITEIIRKDRFGSATEKPEDKPSKENKPAAEGAGETAKKAKSEKELEKEKEKEAREGERKAKEAAEQKKREEVEQEEKAWGLKSLELEENQEQIKTCEPGKPAKYDWKPLADVLPAIKEGKKPALVYVYALDVAKPDDKKTEGKDVADKKPEGEKGKAEATEDKASRSKKPDRGRTDEQKRADQESAYYYEQKIFPNPKFEALKIDEGFILAKANCLEEKVAAELADFYRKLGGKTGVVILDKDLSIGKGGTLLGKLPRPDQFAAFVQEAKAMYAAGAYVPGSTDALAWVSWEQGIEQMKTEKKPALLYLYCGDAKTDKDRLQVYQVEKVFSDERFAKIGERFVTMKVDSSKDLSKCPLVSSKLTNKTMVILWTSDVVTGKQDKKKDAKKGERIWGARSNAMSADDLVKELDDTAKENEVARYEPGSSKAFTWMDLTTGLSKLKGGELPGLLYAYSEEDRAGAHQWEKEVFSDAAFKDLPSKFVMIKANIKDAEKAQDLKLKPQRKPESVVLLLGPDLKLLVSLGANTGAGKFQSAINRVEATLAKEKARAKEE